MNGLVRNFSALIGAVFLPLLSIYIFPCIGGIILKGLRLLFKNPLLTHHLSLIVRSFSCIFAITNPRRVE